MSAAARLPILWAAAGVQAARTEIKQQPSESATHPPARPFREPERDLSIAFYRKHTESMLRRYLYASMLVGRAPEMLSDSIGRGWVSSRPVRSFEDAVIFVLDVERCINRLNSLDRQILSRVILQEYTQIEAAVLLGMGVRTIAYKLPQALDRLTELLLDAGLLLLPH